MLIRDCYAFKFCMIRLCGFCVLPLMLTFDVHSNSNELGYIDDSGLFQADLGFGYDSNLYNSSSVKVNSFYTQPSLKLGIQTGQDIFGFSAGYIYSSFIPEYGDDLAESNVFAIDSFWSPSNNNKYSLNILLEDSDEERGSGLTEGDPLSVDKLDSYQDKTLELNYSFKSSRENSIFLDLNYGKYSRLYDSTRTVALNANFEAISLDMSLGYIWSSEKQLFFQLDSTDTIFKDITDGSKDANNQIALVGVNWPISSQSNFSVAIGTEEKVFDNNDESIYTDYWSASIAWNPLAHTEFSFQSINEQQPSTGVNETSNEQNSLSLNWKHDWGGDYKTVMVLSQILEESIVSSNSYKEENISLEFTTFYRDFEVSIELEKNTDVSTFDSFSQFSLLFIYNFNRGL